MEGVSHIYTVSVCLCARQVTYVTQYGDSQTTDRQINTQQLTGSAHLTDWWLVLVAGVFMAAINCLCTL